MDNVAVIVLASLGLVATTLFFSALFALPVMWLWNGLCPELFHLPTITWMEAWGLQILCAFLFKSSCASSSK